MKKKYYYTQQDNEEKEDINDNDSGMFPFQMSMRKNIGDDDDDDVEDDDVDDFFENWKDDNKKQKSNVNVNNNESESYYDQNQSINVSKNLIKNTIQYNNNNNSNKSNNKNRVFSELNTINEYTKDDKGYKEDNKSSKGNKNKQTDNINKRADNNNQGKVNVLASQFYSKPVYTKESQDHYDIRNNKNKSQLVGIRNNNNNNSTNNAQIQESYDGYPQQINNNNNNINQSPTNQQNNKQKYENNQLGIEDDMKYNSISKENQSILKHIKNISKHEQTKPVDQNKQNDYNGYLFNDYDSDDISVKDEPNPITFKPEILFAIISKLQISETFPFWYIRISDTEYSEGPKSTNNIINEYNKKLLNNESQIRPIDVFQPIDNKDKFMLLQDINHISKEDEFFHKYKINKTIIKLETTYDNIKKEMYEKKFFPKEDEQIITKQNRPNKRKKKHNYHKNKCNIEEPQIKTGFQIEFKG